MSAALSHIRLKVVVLEVVQVKPGPGKRPQSSIRKGEEYEGYLHEGWVYLPEAGNLGLSLQEWRQKWDDLKVDVYRYVGGRFLKLREDKDWDDIQKNPMLR